MMSSLTPNLEDPPLLLGWIGGPRNRVGKLFEQDTHNLSKLMLLRGREMIEISAH